MATEKTTKATKDKKVVDKRGNFVKLINVRMTKTIKGIKLLGNLSVKNSYEYTDTDVAAIEKALNDAVQSVVLRFKGKQSLADSFDITKAEVK